VSDEEKQALRDLYRSIVRWRRQIDKAIDADKKSDANDVLFDLNSEIGESLHYRLSKFDWWMP